MRYPEHDFVEADASALETQITAMYEQLTGLTVEPASPERLFIAWVCAVLVQIAAMINYAGNQNIPSRAEGENLDALGELFSVERPQAKAAVCSATFTISEAQDFDITIPAGTRVTNAGQTAVFETVEELMIPAGQTSASGQLRCQTEGSAGNGYLAGQLNTIVDVFPYYASCANTDASDGGSDAATDEEYYELLRASQDAYSTAGPIGAYAYHAKAVSTQIADVRIVRPGSTVSKTLTVCDGKAFLGGNFLLPDTLTIEGGTLSTDYTVDYTDGLLTISLTSGGALASAETLAVSIRSVDAGCVDIYALMEDGSAASETVKALILAACNDRSVRPLTDKVSVKDPQAVSYNVELTYYTSIESGASSAEVASAVSAAVDRYVAWQAARLGRDVNPSRLISEVMATGLVKRVVVTAPSYAHLTDGSDHNAPQLAALGTRTVTNGGAEDD